MATGPRAESIMEIKAGLAGVRARLLAASPDERRSECMVAQQYTKTVLAEAKSMQENRIASELLNANGRYRLTAERLGIPRGRKGKK